MVYFRPGNQPPAAVKVDEKSNTVRVGSVPPSVAKKIEDKLAAKEADARAPQVGPVKERGQVAAIPADTKLHSAPVHPKAPPSPLQAEGSGDASDPESAARREEAAKELIVDPATEMEARSGGHKSGGGTRSAHKAGKAIPAGSKGGGKRGKYKKPPVVTKPVLLFGVCAAALVCGMIWHSKSKQSVTQAIPRSHLATNAVPLADDADGLPQADTPVPQPKNRNARLSASKPVVDRASLPPMPPQNDNIWKITPKPSPIVPPAPKPSDGGASLPGRPSAALPTGSDALPKGMVPASAVSAQIPQPEVTADLHSVTVRGVKMYVPTDGSAGNLDNLGIDTDFAQAVRLGEGKGGCETSVSSPQ
ncbi:hypothetical protein AA14337_3352 [Acetobacter malorum DSM 14337]|uniref:Uncharacterized protein n=1 Tax=Acetobacter malorum DSM 14337 TaxID=1307910 RepID=A0ABQ0Q138_9PROT|nr:hypothetical protein AA14337_3352 [Acetobacter malorum DSM 14337]